MRSRVIRNVLTNTLLAEKPEFGETFYYDAIHGVGAHIER